MGGLGSSIRLLAAVIVRYSNSYLDGDRHGVFLGWLTTTIAAVEVLVLAANLGLLVVAWVATSASLHRPRVLSGPSAGGGGRPQEARCCPLR